jgi:hypothetical protein
MNCSTESVACMIAVLLTLSTACGRPKPVSPDLTEPEAARLISRAPELNRYAQLLTVDNTTRDGDSLRNCCYHGQFTFRYLNAETGAAPIKAYAEFRYYDREWHFTSFEYGCPGTQCQSVVVAAPARKGRTPY